MAQRKTLTQAQLDLLQWVADGCPGGVFEGFNHHVSAAALRRRGLLRISGHGEQWKAAITDAGQEYLQQSKEPGAELPRQANVSVTEELIQNVEAAGGLLRVKHERGPGSVNWEARVRATIERGKVPAGKKLSCRWNEDEFEISLEDLAPGLDPRLIKVSVPERVARYHPVIKRFRDDSEHIEVSRAHLGRASRILQALVSAAEERGWNVRNVEPGQEARRRGRGNWTGANHGHVLVSVEDFSQAIQIREEGLPSRAHWEKELRASRPYWAGEPRQKPIGKYEEKATGKLAIALVPSFGGRKWADRKSWTLEEKLPEVIQEIEISAAADRHRREEAERAKERRQREWEAAMEAAKEKYLEAWCADKLVKRGEAWRQVEDLRAYCDAVEARHPLDRNPETAKWVEWARSYIERVDPLRAAPQMPADPENVTGEDLRPFLRGRSLYGPDGWR
jgi:hypothetical protein